MKNPTASFFPAEVITGEPHLYLHIYSRTVRRPEVRWRRLHSRPSSPDLPKEAPEIFCSGRGRLLSDLPHRLIPFATYGEGYLVDERCSQDGRIAMRIDSPLQHRSVPPHNTEPPGRRVLIAVVMLAVALLALAPSAAWLGERAGRATPAERPIADHAAQQKSGGSASFERTPASVFFGFLEFDWDPNAAGGVPGFDPWPRSQP